MDAQQAQEKAGDHRWNGIAGEVGIDPVPAAGHEAADQDAGDGAIAGALLE